MTSSSVCQLRLILVLKSVLSWFSFSYYHFSYTQRHHPLVRTKRFYCYWKRCWKMIAHWCYWKDIICCRRWLYNVFPADTADAAADALPLCVLLSIADKEKRYFYFSTFLFALLLFLFLLLLFRRCSMMTLSVCLTD